MLHIAALSVVLVGQTATTMSPKVVQPKTANFKKQIVPFLSKFCVACHSGPKPKDGIDFSIYKTDADVKKNPRPLMKGGHEVEEGQMPPKPFKNQPTDAQKAMFTKWAKSLKSSKK